MRRFAALLLAICLLVSLSACGTEEQTITPTTTAEAKELSTEIPMDEWERLPVWFLPGGRRGSGQRRYLVPVLCHAREGNFPVRREQATGVGGGDCCAPEKKCGGRRHGGTAVWGKGHGDDLL